jgi:hypothetical protein
MKTIKLLVKIPLLCAVSVVWAHASDPMAIYARVDKVVLEPNPDLPDTIQVLGVFSMAKPNDRTDFLPPARGYLYFKLTGNDQRARKEWADLKQVAGTGQIISFGNRYQMKARLRKPEERLENPDPYVVSIGLAKVRSDTQYPPVRALADYKD